MAIPITQKVRTALHQLLQREAAAVLQPPHVSQPWKLILLILFFNHHSVVVVVVVVLIWFMGSSTNTCELADCPAVSFGFVYLHKNNYM